MPNLEFIEINPENDPRYSVIWMHGLGADGHDFESIVYEMNLPKELKIRFIFPHAPKRSITINGGFVMRGWYDILNLEFKKPREDEAGIRSSEKLIRELIQTEKQRGIPAGNIMLAGFSQGAAMALQTGLRYEEKLAGILSLSGYLTLPEQLEKEKTAANQNIPIMMMHGTMDNIVPIQYAKQSRDRLKELGHSIDWKEYPMPHSVCAQEIQDIRAWFLEVLR